ncbi:MAG: hypothetical protein ACC662_03450, partial [Planctomycetota bacterium]
TVAEAGASEGGGGAAGDGGAAPEGTEQIREMVDEAVARKAAQLRRMRDKKPPIAVFAKTLGLDGGQREVVEQEVLRGQREIQAILEIPAADGTYFLDELVEVLADGLARPGQNPGRGMKLFGRLLAEEIPGTSETYAERVEAVKKSVRDTFRRDLTQEQYALFEAWEMDPTEIKGIEGSPWKDLERRVIERARDLGATLPEDDE